MKNNLKKYSLILLIIILSVFCVSQYFSNKETQDTLIQYKNVIIESDSLRKVSDGHYQRLVDDRNTQKDLRDLLKDQNKELFELLKTQNKKPISYTIIQAKPETKIDTIPIIKETKDGQVIKSFDSFYPTKENYFANHKGVIGEESIQEEWNFRELEIGLVISEKEKGLFEADLDAPDWLKVNKIEVNSLPLENIKKDNFDWVLGVQGGLNFTNYTPVVDLEGGIRLKNTMVTLIGNTNKEFKIGLKKFL